MRWDNVSIIKRISRSYPYLYPTTFDFIPLMSFQQALDPDLEICHLRGHVSVHLGYTRDSWKRDDIQFSVSQKNPRMMEIKYDSGSFEDTISQRALWEQIIDELGIMDLNELNITLRVPVIKIPSKLDLGIDSVATLQSKIGNLTKEMRRRFRLYELRNPYLMIKNELRERGLWQWHYSRRLRGILKTTNLIGMDGRRVSGWQEFLKKPEMHRFPPQVNELNWAIISDRWWQDNGIPVRMVGSYDESRVEAVVYLLHRRRALIAA